MEAVLRTPWSGKNYSQRIWQNTEKLAKTIKGEVMTSVHRGESVAKLASRVSKEWG